VHLTAAYLEVDAAQDLASLDARAQPVDPEHAHEIFTMTSSPSTITS
jgi:hypothetical protein